MSLVSVIVPIYNSSEYLDGLFENLCTQTFGNIEIICVDDGSTDNSADVIAEYIKKDTRIKYLYQENQGGGAARNNGISAAKGEYIICLDSDDIFEKKLIETLYQKAKATDADITICKYHQINLITGKISRCKGVVEKMLPDKEVFSRKDVDSIFEITNPAPWNKLYKSDFIKRNNIKYTHSKRSNDIAFCMVALALADKITTVDDELVTYRCMSNISGTKTRGKYAADCVKIYKSIYEELCTRNLFEFVKQSFINSISSCIVYELSFHVDTHSLEVFRQYLNEEPFCETSKQQLREIFKIKSIKKKYFEYLFYKILTFGLNKSIVSKCNNYRLMLRNFKDIGV